MHYRISLIAVLLIFTVSMSFSQDLVQLDSSTVLKIDNQKVYYSDSEVIEFHFTQNLSEVELSEVAGMAPDYITINFPTIRKDDNGEVIGFTIFASSDSGERIRGIANYSKGEFITITWDKKHSPSLKLQKVKRVNKQ